MTEEERILDAINFLFKKQGYVDLEMLSQMTSVPSIITRNVLAKNNYKESVLRNGQYIKR